MIDDPFDLDDLDSPPFPPSVVEQVEPAYMQSLNDAQREAVLAVDGPVLVLAGAGTGKTRVLTTRLGHLLATGVTAPWNILCVTFTNKAANEMKNRVARIMGRPVDDMWIGTFHSVASKILRIHAEMVGLKSNFTILDTDDQIRLLKQLIQAEGIDDKRWPARMMAGLIDRWKNQALTPDRISSDESFSFADGKGGKIYSAYQARLQVLNAVDFGDLLLHNITLFQKHPDIIAKYQDIFRFVLVDEYQDTNVAQYLWLRLLAQKHRNICCVGDDDQSIYGWRGAEVGNILRFSTDYENAVVVRLEQNYRSTGNILAAASALISSNENRLGKTLWTEAEAGDKITVKGVWDGPEEARYIGEEIEALQSKGCGLNEMAILVRAGFQMREFEERLIQLGVAYRVVGGPRFYERAEIRDAMAYLRVIAQPDDDLAFERIINVPKRGLGTKAVQKIHDLARSMNISMTRAALQLTDIDELRPQARKSLKSLMEDFDRWRAGVKDMPHTELAEMVMDESGYTAMWMNDKSPDAPGRLENLKEMVSGMTHFEDLAGFLEHISLVMANEEKDDTNKVSLMTLHAAKGLEFDNVFLPGWEEGVFPNQRSLDEGGNKSLEEERRLAYVGLTRAKKKATITFAGTRMIFGQWQSSQASRFIEELPEDNIDMEATQGLYGSKPSSGWGSEDFWDNNTSQQNNSQSGYGAGWQRARKASAGTSYGERSKPKSRSRTIPGKAKKVELTTDFAVGERVFHEKFGYGIIEDTDGNKLEINFDKAGLKKVLDSFVTPA